MVNKPAYVCLCEPAGCKFIQHEEEGRGIVQGRVVTKRVFKKHQSQAALELANSVVQSTDSAGYLNTRLASTSVSAATTDATKVYLEEGFCKQVMMQMVKLVFSNKLSKRGAVDFLNAARENVVLLGNIWSSTLPRRIDTSAIVEQIPKTQEAVFHWLRLNPELTSQVCCTRCFKLYPMAAVHGREKRCTEPFLSPKQGYCKWAESQQLAPTCDQRFTSLGYKDASCNRVLRPCWSAVWQLATGRNDQPMEDVWHGHTWRNFPNSDNGTGKYTHYSGNLVFTLYTTKMDEF
ncbi:hypothetical protein PTTG_30112, partial [Puccinia triticina 1-1 BBBD Race 1]